MPQTASSFVNRLESNQACKYKDFDSSSAATSGRDFGLLLAAMGLMSLRKAWFENKMYWGLILKSLILYIYCARNNDVGSLQRGAGEEVEGWGGGGTSLSTPLVWFDFCVFWIILMFYIFKKQINEDRDKCKTEKKQADDPAIFQRNDTFMLKGRKVISVTFEHTIPSV